MYRFLSFVYPQKVIPVAAMALLLPRPVTHICLVISFIRMYQGPDEEMRLISIGRPPNWCCPYKASILSSALAAPFPNLSTIHCGSLLCAGLGWAGLGWAGQNIKNFAAFIWLSSSSRHAASTRDMSHSWNWSYSGHSLQTKNSTVFQTSWISFSISKYSGWFAYFWMPGGPSRAIITSVFFLQMLKLRKRS